MDALSHDLEAALGFLWQVNSGYRELYEMGAITREKALDSLGKESLSGTLLTPWWQLHNAHLGFNPNSPGHGPISCAQYARMVAEHDLWLAGELDAATSTAGTDAAEAGATEASATEASAAESRTSTPDQWLFHVSDDDSPDAFPEATGGAGGTGGASGAGGTLPCEAGIYEKDWFFRMLVATFTPIEFFEPIPEDIEQFSATLQQDEGCDEAELWIQLDWLDDGGLLAHPSPVGKTFTLTATDGTQAILTVTELIRDQWVLRQHKRVEVPAFLARGSVEGYTAPNSARELRVLCDSPDAISDIAYSFPYGTRHEDPDFAAFRSYPRWQRHFAWLDDKISRVDAAQLAAKEAYLRGER